MLYTKNAASRINGMSSNTTSSTTFLSTTRSNDCTGANPGGGGEHGGQCPPFRSEPTQIAAVCRALSARRRSADVCVDIQRYKVQLPRDSFVVAAMR